MKQSIGATALLLILLCSFSIYSNEIKASASDCKTYQAMADQVIKLIPEKRPVSFRHDEIRKLFDVNSYFTVLDHLEVGAHYKLDYSYCSIHRYGHPYIYKRPKDKQPYDPETACSILSDFIWKPDEFEKLTKNYIEAITIDGTPESFIQFAILYLIGDQFFLSDHANYDDDIIIFTKSKLAEVIDTKLSFSKEYPPPDYVLEGADKAKKEAVKLDVTPVYKEDKNRIYVKVITFSKWGGFQQHTFTFTKNGIFCFDCKKVKTLIPYNCGLMF